MITRPRQLLLEASYGKFQEAYDVRTRVIFAGTNGGWLEAFHAGAYDTSTQKYGAGTGVELFGFMPWQARKAIKKLDKAGEPVLNSIGMTNAVFGGLGEPV